MGNRKERRLAAKTGSNRRVKLDLHLPEPPSGDFGDPSNKEEVGGGDNANTHAGSPDSPSSSGQKPENPLMLLGQYSDEEVEEDSSKDINHDNRESSPAAPVEQAKIDNHESTKTDKDENIAAEKVDQVKAHSSPLNVLQKLEENGVIEDNKTKSPHRDMDAEDQASVPFTTDTQTPGDVDSGWKMVLHEESNSYYYWNTVTGETSWEVPVALTHGSESAYDPKSGPQVEEPHVTSVDNVMTYEATEINGSRPGLDMYNEEYTDIMANGKNEGNHANLIDGGNMPSSNDVNYGFGNVEAHHMDSTQDMTGYVYQGTDGDSSSDSFRLLQLGENLSERLKSLNGLEACNDQLAKLTFELDIRLADIKSLVPYGSSLLPFWLHSENQLKLLEAAINNEVLKCSQFANTGQTNQAENRSLENVCGTANDKNPPTSIKLDYSDHHDISKETDKVLSDATAALPKDSTTTVEAHENAVEAEAVPIVAPHSVEDVDMDVEMEVEDESSVLNGAQLDQSIPPIPHGQPESHGSEDIPPLPNDEWIPPPPPDDESMPPPPPDEPPEASIPTPPSEVQAAQPYSYGQQYSFSYPGSGFEYYGQTNNLTTGVASNGYYVDANGCQVAAPVQTLYYPAVPNPYPDATGEPVTYYTLQEGSMQTAPVQANIAFDQTESSTEVPSRSVSAHALGTSTVTSSVSMVSAPAVATTVAPTESAPKVQPKVARNKKRTVAAVTSLRSNKKVSGLVDKWKAVKEEMHEDEEDEPEDALEALEKKRQREIEQWRAQQIASGEAKDNANFQPLGGDWRERIRRKRAKKSVETEESVAKANDDTNQQPDLVELTKQLPSGWQAYWDEASKEVYYGNTKTSETTWIKPTN